MPSRGFNCKLARTPSKEAHEKVLRAALHLIAVHRPEGATVRAFFDGKPLVADGDAKEIPLRSAFAPRVLNVNFHPVEVKAGTRIVELECVEPGAVGLDTIWVKAE